MLDVELTIYDGECHAWKIREKFKTIHDVKAYAARLTEVGAFISFSACRKKFIPGRNIAAVDIDIKED